MLNVNRSDNITIKYTKTKIPDEALIQLLCESLFKTAQKNNSERVSSNKHKQTGQSQK